MDQSNKTEEQHLRFTSIPQPKTRDCIRKVSNALSYGLGVRISSNGVTVAESAFLRSLQTYEPISPSLLAEKMGITRGGVSRLADRLYRKRLVTRSESDGDVRTHTLALSPHGHELMPILSALDDENEASYFSVLTSAELETLHAILLVLIERHGPTNTPSY